MRFRESRGRSILPRHNFDPLPFLFRDDKIITLLSGTVKHHSNRMQVQVIGTTFRLMYHFEKTTIYFTIT